MCQSRVRSTLFLRQGLLGLEPDKFSRLAAREWSSVWRIASMRYHAWLSLVALGTELRSSDGKHFTN